MIYIYPLGFESKHCNRKGLIVYSIIGILIFQLGMFLIAGTVLERIYLIYLFSFLLVEVMAIITTFEFFRKPWEGQERELERTIQDQQNNVLDSISSMHASEHQIG